jgi:hypothetical protein
LAALAEVDGIVRWGGDHPDADRVTFARFIEAGTVDDHAALDACRSLLTVLGQGSAHIAARATVGEDAIRAEARKAARGRGSNTLLSRRVRLSDADRESAALYLLSQAADLTLDPEEMARGQFNLERLLGLRSGRGGSTRDVEELILPLDGLRTDPKSLTPALGNASPETVALARRAVEVGCLWLPALLPVLGVERTPQNVAFLDIADETTAHATPEYYAGMFAHTVYRLTHSPPRDHQVLEDDPAILVASDLANRTSQEVDLLRSRLRAPQRVRLRAALWALLTTRSSL